MRAGRGTTEETLELASRGPTWVAVAATAAALLLCWVIALDSGSLTAVSRHWFYIPVVFAAVRFGVLGAALVAVMAGLLAGPLVLTVEVVDPQAWAIRGGFFLIVGLFVAGLAAIARDSLARSLRIAQREREIADQRAALIQTISHEFRTPLTVLSGTIQTLRGRPDAVAEPFRPLLDAAARAERGLSEMVAVVLAAADATEQAQHQRQEPVVVADMLEDVLASIPEGEHRVLVEVGHGAERIVTAPAHLRLALRELVVNALRFSPGDEPVEVRASRDDTAVTIRVRDHGPGMDDSDFQRALQPFVQLDPSTTRRVGGLGMGLFTARRLAEGLAGSLALSRAPTGGLDATLTIPQQRTSDRYDTPRGADTAGSRVSRRRSVEVRGRSD